ncbi:MAG: prepilin-type N-terminal cleavage/methylation domain-containing protein [Cyanobacteria bacterium M_surface_7_m2_040]|nr:prepilin-type N-terminal cleavage/methylation domain-containing protein [Cyanobacteria bacterium M_surface_7_m2_040]
MQRSDPNAAGLTLPELLLAVLVLGLLAAVGLGGVGRSLARTRVEAAARQLAVGLEQARSHAQASGSPCALALGSSGWREAAAGELIGELPPCPLSEGTLRQGVRLSHNLPAALRISSNGLVLDGGTVVLGADGTTLQRCLVVSLPLGVVRQGESQATPGAPPRSSDCVVDPLL